MGFINNRIAGSPGPGFSTEPSNLERVLKDSGQTGKNAQQLKTAVKRPPSSNSSNPRARALPGRTNQPVVAQTLQQRATPVKRAPVAIPGKIGITVEQNNFGKTSIGGSETTDFRNGRQLIKTIKVDVDKKGVGGTLSWNEKYPVGASTNRTSESAIGYDATTNSFNASHKQGISAKVGNGGQASAEIGLDANTKKGASVLGSIGYRQKLSASTEVGLKVEFPVGGLTNAQVDVVKNIDRTELGAKWTQPLAGAGNLELRVKRNIGEGSFAQISGTTGGEFKLQGGLTFTP